MVVVLAGGTGGAKLAAGFADEIGPGELTVIANTADDVEFYGVHVSPDPDLVTWWLGGLIDERGWGIAGDSFEVVDAIAASGRPAWFRLGDRDLAMCMVRTAELRAGRRLTEAHQAVVDAVKLRTRVLPMSDDPVRTHVKVRGAWHAFQEFMIVERAEGPIEGLEFRGLGHAAPSPEVLDAIAGAEVIVIGPSNPIISIRPILELPGLRDALQGVGRAGRRRVAVPRRSLDQGAERPVHGVRPPAAGDGRCPGGVRRCDRWAGGRLAGGARRLPGGAPARHRHAHGGRRRKASSGRNHPAICEISRLIAGR